MFGMKANRNFGCAFFLYSSLLCFRCQFLVHLEQSRHNIRLAHLCVEAVRLHHRLEAVLSVRFAMIAEIF